jgi:serine/threonine protein kinase
MSSTEDPLLPLEFFQQLSDSCQAIEVAFRSGQSIDLEALIGAFPTEYQTVARTELQGVFDELRSPISQSQSSSCNSRYEAKSDYKVLETFAQGGMGQVMVAWDEEFSRRVALKEIQLDSADDERFQRRFLQESLVTARLEHPGILPIYNRGINSQERLFFTMRLVAGGNAKTLHQAIEEFDRTNPKSYDYQSNLRNLLRRLIDVCNTVAYAHSQGVCHRDLKPANILIGPFGETLVVDWGLAKTFQPNGKSINPNPALNDKDSDNTQTGSPIESSSNSPLINSLSAGVGTRGFVAPECYRPEPIGSWPRVDVFSVGVILHCILTGKSPRNQSDNRSHPCDSSNTASSNKRISQPFEILPPGQVQLNTPKALEAICLKAIATAPQDRYASTLEIASDLESYLAGQPISLLREGPIDRAIRWVNNNRMLAVAWLAFGTLATISMGVIAIQQTTYSAALMDKSQKLSDSLAKESKLLVNESKLREQEKTARLLAENQENIARKREVLALKALRSYTDAITSNAKLKNSQELGSVRRELLESPLALFEQIDQDETLANNPSWDYLSELARTTLELAKLSFEYGDPVQCARWADRSIQRFSQLVDLAEDTSVGNPDQPEFHERLASAKIDLGTCYRLRGRLQMPLDPNAARNHFQQATEVFDQASEINKIKPNEENTKRLLDDRADLYALEAILEAEQRNPRRMAELFEMAIRDLEDLLTLVKTSTSKSDKIKQQLIETIDEKLDQFRQDYANVSLILQYGDRESHFRQFQKHVGILKEKIHKGNATELTRLKLAWALRNLGAHYRDVGLLDASEGILKEALNQRQVIATMYPSVSRYRADVAGTMIDLAVTVRRLGRIDQAIELTSQGIEGYRELLRESPIDSYYRVDLITQLHSLGHLQLDNFLDQQAEASFNEAFEISKRVLEFDPSLQPMMQLYPELLRHQATLQLLNGQWHDATKSFELLWNSRSALGTNASTPNDERKEILDLWEYSCFRAEDSQTAQQVYRLKATLDNQAVGDPLVDLANDATWIDRIKEKVTAAEQELLAADKAYLAKKEAQATEFEQQALGTMQELILWFEDESKVRELTQDQLLAIWNLTLRNPKFVSVRLSSELERWPIGDRQEWEKIWRKLRSLPN